MWSLVLVQLENSKAALLNNNKELAKEIRRKEKIIDALELKIDADCEYFIALYAPKAMDMRLVLSIINISVGLERIADFTNGIAKYILKDDREQLDSTLITEIEIEKMFNELISMLNNCFVAFENEDVSRSNEIIAQDDEIDRIYYKSPDILAKYVQNKPEIARETLRFMVILKKLERIGDHCSNIMEELVFYVDANVLKHKTEKM